MFEEVVADLLSRQGYEVTVTPASRDGGKDIYAAKKDIVGSFLYIVECKKYSPDDRVGVGLIRQLYGVVQAEKATAGIMATTSFFTKGAQEFQSRVAYQISLQDYFGIQKWLWMTMPK
jgi:restriction system protein